MEIPKRITPLLAEEVGWHIGDGSMNWYSKQNGKNKGFYQLRGHHTDDKHHYIKRIKPTFKKLYDIDISLRDMPSTRVFGFQLWNNTLVAFKQELGLPLGKKTNIVIPETFLKTEELTKSVLRGIFGTDGCIYLDPRKEKLYPRMEIKTISKTLAIQIHKEFNNLGLRTTKYLYEDNGLGNRKPSYTIVTRGEKMLELFMKTICPKNPKFIQKYYFYCQKIL